MADRRQIYILEVAEYCGLDADSISELMEHGFIQKHEGLESNFFTSEELALMRRIRRLNAEMGINLAGIEVILHMRERILQLQRELEMRRRGLSQFTDEGFFDLE